MTDFSDVSNADIAERTARDVMGWDHPTSDVINEGWWWDGDERIIWRNEWDPVDDARHRDRLIERANELGLAIKVMRYPDGTSDAHVYDTNEDGWPKTGIASSHKEEGRAVCEAILKAINQQKQN